jgi:hypothetical protein
MWRIFVAPYWTARVMVNYMYKFLFDLTDGGSWLVDVHASS